MASLRSPLRSRSLKILLTKLSTSFMAPLATPSKVPTMSRLGRVGVSRALSLKILLTNPSTSLTAPLATPSSVPIMSRRSFGPVKPGTGRPPAAPGKK